MKHVNFIFLLLPILLCGCGNNTQQVNYMTHSAQGKEYSVEIPSYIPLKYNNLGGYMAFARESGNSSECKYITIQPTRTGFSEFNKVLEQHEQNYTVTVYHNTSTEKFASCTKGLFNAVDLAMIKNIDGVDYLITYIAVETRSHAEPIIRHIYESLQSGIQASVESADARETYSNPYLSISYPSDWIAVDRPNEMMDAYVGSEDGSIGFSITRFSTDESLANILSESQQDAIRNGMKITSNTTVTINGTTGNRRVTECQRQGMSIKTIGYSFKKGSLFYSISFGSQKQSVDANAQVIEEIINSLIIK